MAAATLVNEFGRGHSGLLLGGEPAGQKSAAWQNCALMRLSVQF